MKQIILIDFIFRNEIYLTLNAQKIAFFNPTCPNNQRTALLAVELHLESAWQLSAYCLYVWTPILDAKAELISDKVMLHSSG